MKFNFIVPSKKDIIKN